MRLSHGSIRRIHEKRVYAWTTPDRSCLPCERGEAARSILEPFCYLVTACSSSELYLRHV